MFRVNPPVALVLSIIALSHASSKPCPPGKWVAESVALKSTGGTFASEINRDKGAKKALRNVLSHLDNLGRMLETHDKTRGDSWLCHKFHGYQDAQALIKSLGWRPMEGNCTYGIRHDTFLANSSDAEDQFKTISAFHDAVAPMGPAIARSYGVRWQSIETAGVLPYIPEDSYRQCKLARLFAFRFNGRWAASAVFTNVSVSIDSSNRGVLREVITVDDTNSAKAVTVRKAVCAGKKKRDVSHFQSGTCILEKKSGPISPYHFLYRKKVRRKPGINANPSVIAAIVAGEFEKEMVEASDSLSNLAILILPVALALLPIALFQDTGMLATVLYAIATDVVSVMPIALKGFELIVYGSNRHYMSNHFLNGFGGGSPTATAQSWAAECGMKPFVRQKGVVLLVGAVLAMIFGVILEFVARGVVHRRAVRKQWRDSVWNEHQAFLRQVPKKSGGLKRSSSVEYSSNKFPFRGDGKRLGFFGR